MDGFLRKAREVAPSEGQDRMEAPGLSQFPHAAPWSTSRRQMAFQKHGTMEQWVPLGRPEEDMG